MEKSIVVNNVEEVTKNGKKYYFVHSIDGTKWRYFTNDNEERERIILSLLSTSYKNDITIKANIEKVKGYDVLWEFTVVSTKERAVEAKEQATQVSKPIQSMNYGDKRALLSNLVSNFIANRYSDKATKEKNWETIEYFYDRIMEKIG